jgi:hypothetical protein
MQNDLQGTAIKHMGALESWLAPIFAKAPHLPQNARTSLANVAPWLALIFGILGLFALISAGLFASIASFSFAAMGMGFLPILMFLTLIVGVISAVMEILAFKPLQARKKNGWNLLFYGMVLSAIVTILNLIFSYGSLGSLIGLVIGFWLLFEIRAMYQ